MNRRIFIKISALTSLIIGIFPTSIFSRSQGNQLLFELPKMNTHLRHGLLTEMTESISKLAPSWLSDYRKEIFLKDGLSESNADLTYISMKINQQLLNIGLKRDSFFIATNKDTSSTPIIENKVIPFYSNGDFTGSLLKFNKEFLIAGTNNHEILLIPFRRNIHINDKVVDDNSGILLKSMDSIKITTDDEVILGIFRYLKS